ncbi:MAG: PAS domain S-box protein [Sinimarinibacterium sp.]|jgi:diguanylate cyclase (GGDEF)-like protein/PAS domain S-box-containing protein
MNQRLSLLLSGPRHAADDEESARWRKAVEATGQGVWDWNAVTDEVYYSPRWKAMLGYADAEVGSTPDERDRRVHPDDRQARDAALQAHFDGRTPMYVSEHRARCKDGGYKWILDQGRVVARSAAGRPERVIGTYADITARKLAEDRQRCSEARFRAVFNSAFQMVGVLDPSGIVLEGNETALLFGGLTEADVVGREVWELPFFRESEGTRNLIRGAVEQAGRGEEFRAQIGILGANDIRMTIDLVVKPVRNPDGRVSLLIIQGQDISERISSEQAIRQSEERFQLTFAEAPIGIALVSTDGRWLEVNDALCAIVGYARDELLRATFQDITHPDDLQADLEHVRQMLTGEIQHYRMAKRYFHKDGRIVHVQLDVSLVRDASGGPLYFIAQIQDISERLHLHHELQSEKVRLEVALSSITDAVLILDAGGNVEFANPVAERFLGIPAGTDARRNVAELLDLREEDSEQTVQLLRADSPHRASFRQGSARYCRREAPPLVVEYALAPLKNDAGEPMGFALTLHDVTQARALTRAFEHQATHDALTGLLNRIGFERQIESLRFRAARHGDAWCLLYLDLDRFKMVNDTAGHAVGDELLRALTIRMRSVLRTTDTFARLGGDEFGVILADCTVEDAEKIANKLIEAVDAFRFRRDGALFQIGLSIGVATGSSSSSVADLLRMADTACYVAKRTGRNRACVYSDSVIEGVAASAEFDSLYELQRAIDEDRLRVFAQKIVDVNSGVTVGVELLLRMEMPDGSSLLPDRFLAVAERHDLITRLDGWMLGRAVRLIRGTDATVPADWFVTVNVSGLSMSDPRFHRVISEQIGTDRMLRDRIYFEITESAAPSNWANTRQGIDLLRSHGLRVLVDDFGSGFMSFDYLRDLHVDGLKIANEFTRDLATDPINDTVVALVASLSQRLKISAIAEGVEDEAGRLLIAAKGIGMAQGFHFHRPEPIENLLTRH